MLEWIAFDTDNTLWYNQTYFAEAQARYSALMAQYLEGGDEAVRHLYQTESCNIPRYGYGVKGFGLSMIESAIALTGGRIASQHIQALVELTKEMLEAPVRVLPEVEQTLDCLSDSYRLMVITKGDLTDQEAKLMRSGLSEYFHSLEVVSEKDRHAYTYLLRHHGIRPNQFLMVGSNLASDVMPVLDVGGQAVYIPAHSTAQSTLAAPRSFVQLESFGKIPQWLAAEAAAA